MISALLFSNQQPAAKAGGGGGATLPQGVAKAFSGLEAPAAQRVRPGQLARQLMNTPGYEFIKNEGVDSIMGNASALGLRKSGVNTKDIGRFVSGSVAFPFYQDYTNRLAALSGGAQTASTTVGQNNAALGANFGLSNAQLVQNTGNAQAAGTLGQAGAWQNTITDLAKIAGNYFGD